MSTDRLLEEIQALPAEAQREVEDFVTFLRRRYGPAKRRRSGVRASLADEPFVGMWRGRLDLADSSSWVRQTREQQWKRSGA